MPEKGVVFLGGVTPVGASDPSRPPVAEDRPFFPLGAAVGSGYVALGHPGRGGHGPHLPFVSWVSLGRVPDKKRGLYISVSKGTNMN